MEDLLATARMVRPSPKLSSTSTDSGKSTTSSTVSSTAMSGNSTPSPTSDSSDMVTSTESILLVKRLLTASISKICFARGIFSSDFFTEKHLPGKGTVKILKTSGTDGNLNRDCVLLLKFLQGAFEALDKRYLRVLMFGISTASDSMDVADECYSFLFDYAEDGTPTMTIVDSTGNSHCFLKKKIMQVTYGMMKRSVGKVMRKLTAMVENLEQFRSKPHLTVKLLYYDERTPAEYEPPSFRACSVDHFEPNGLIRSKVNIGNIKTNVHTMEVGFWTVLGYMDEDEESTPSKKSRTEW